MLLEYQHSD